MTNPGTANLVGWWSLDETSGDRADSHGAFTMTDVNTVGSTTGVQSNATNHASGEYLTHAAGLGLHGASFTVGAWIRADDLLRRHVLTEYNPPPNYEFLLRVEGGGTVQFFLASAGTHFFGVYATNHGAISTGTWYFVVAWHDDAANEIGVSVNDVSNTAGWTYTHVEGTGPFRIGETWTGRIDEAFAFNDVLTPAERTWLYNSGSGRAYSEVAGGAGALLRVTQEHHRAVFEGGVPVG